MSSINCADIQVRLRSVADLSSSRLPRHGRHGSRVTIFPSKKNGAPLMCESLLEAAFCLELERRADVASYKIHPYTLNFKNSKYRYTPDFEVTYTSGAQQLIEVKNDESFECIRTKSRLLRITDLLAENDCLLECLPMRCFYNAARAINLDYLYHRSYSSNGLADRAIQDHLSKQGQATPIYKLLENAFNSIEIAHALFYRAVECNLRKPITVKTLAWLK
ncbi:Tn7 transposase TnsA N-terminal domain-containing protein [Pseudomonas putida]|uniref:hypothetical protein n=1 Tax=Pseudomonas putida TaxID=303 RepID=UPI0023631A0B|nr:hypothetical protein [Pseudomonas putida]MDD2029218.1 Tn7 transposase TnsA N-terminal domain-containing protein [Pseudomonas putida]HDS1769538.1 hypothetical protein [Pseudomonas putida]